MPTGVIRLKLGAAHGTSRKRLHQQLSEACRQLNVARNGMLWHWMAWRKEHPEWQPEQRLDRAGNPKVDKSGKPMLESLILSSAEQKAMYSYARQCAPNVASKVVSQAWSSILQRLRDNVPYNHVGKSRYVWQALVAHERSVDNFVALSLPVPTQDATIYYRGLHSHSLSSGVKQRIEQYAGNSASAVLRFPLWSRESGYSQTDVIVRLAIRKLSRGNRRLVSRIAAGELRMLDSLISERNGEWFLNLCYHVPIVDHHLDVSRVMTLSVGHECSFIVRLPEENTIRVGDDRPLVAEAKRLEVRRKTLRYRTKHGHGRGHGKQRFYDRLRPHSRRFVDMQDEYRKQLIAQVIRLCVQENCGTIHYREPTKPLRLVSWFAKQGLPFNWTALNQHLKFKAECHGLALPKPEKMRMSVREFNESSSRAMGTYAVS